MDAFSTQFSDPHPSSSPTRVSSSDSEELSLAASCPKKRAGRRIFRETRHPVFRGVRRRNGDKWVCELREPMKKTRIWLGTYPTPEMAARAHDVAALALRGKSACLNFADSLWRLPVPVSAEAGDIRKAANEAAEMFRPRKEACDDVEGMGMGMDMISGDGECDGECKVVYVDEEAVFDMPRLLAYMAEGLLLSPPQYGSVEWEQTEITDSDISLWSFL